MTEVRYFVSRDDLGEVTHLARITTTETSISGQYFQNGQWIDAGWVMEYLVDGSGDEISEADATGIIREISPR
jgi:hypothetical protein